MTYKVDTVYQSTPNSYNKPIFKENNNNSNKKKQIKKDLTAAVP